jgi:ATP-binding cassette subfamily B protein
MADNETDAPPSRKLGNLGLIWRFAIRYPGRIVGAGLTLLVAAAATLAIPDGFRRIIDNGFTGAESNIGEYFYYLIMIVVVLAIATSLRFYFVSWLGERVVADLRIATHRNLLALDPKYFEENRPSEIASRMTSDTSVIEMIVGTTISVALRNIVMGIGGIAYLFTLSPKLAAMLVLGIPAIIIPIAVLGRRLRDLSRHSQDRIADVGAMVAETLGAMKVVQAFGQERRESERFGNAVEQAFGTAKRRITIRAIMTAIVITLIFGAITMVMWQAASDVISGRITGGAVAAFVLTGMIVAGAFGALTEVYGELMRGAGAAGRLDELMREVPEIRPPAHPKSLPVESRGALGFEHVTFRYPTRPETKALDDFDLAVEPGELVAVVGPSGAGKSTLFQLAQRFYDPGQGRITLDGVDLRDADPADIRARIAMVPQETVIFASSARDNLRYGDWEASDEALWAAAEAANAAEYLRALPDGLDTFMGEGGARLSGGQRQRLAIARALLRDSPLLLLDEATSALDAESEQLVQQALERLMENRTTIVIAHRLATVRSADRIVVMENGRIVEQGSHSILAGQGGLYARLAQLQFESDAA